LIVPAHGDGTGRDAQLGKYAKEKGEHLQENYHLKEKKNYNSNLSHSQEKRERGREVFISMKRQRQQKGKAEMRFVIEISLKLWRFHKFLSVHL
jgi:hypothetical protein